MNILSPAFHPALKGESKCYPIPFSLINNASPSYTNFYLLALASGKSGYMAGMQRKSVGSY